MTTPATFAYANLLTATVALTAACGGQIQGTIDGGLPPSFASVFFTQVDGDPFVARLGALTVDDGCNIAAAIEEQEQAAATQLGDALNLAGGDDEAAAAAREAHGVELDRIYDEHLPTEWWRAELRFVVDDDLGGATLKIDDAAEVGEATFTLRHQKERENYTDTFSAGGAPADFDPHDLFKGASGNIDVLEYVDESKLAIRGTLDLLEIDLDEPFDEQADSVTLELVGTWCPEYEEAIADSL